MTKLAHIGLVFGTDTGNTEEVGGKIAKALRAYSYTVAFNENKTEFCGLAIDEDQQFELTDSRVQAWVKQIVAEYQRCALAS
jgi:flavodoxin